MAPAPRMNLTPATRPPNKPVVNIDNTAITPAVITQLLTLQTEQLEIQRKEQEINAKEQEIRLKEIESANSYSHAALQAQVADRASVRSHVLAMKQTRYRYWLIAGLAIGVLLVGGSLYCVAHNQTTLVMDTIKTVVPPLITAVSGYFIGLSRGRPKMAADDNAAEIASVK